MSVCEFHPNYEQGSKTSTVPSEKEPNTNIQEELTWGLSYRNYKRKEKDVPMPTKKSPMDIPFKICRERERQKIQARRDKRDKKKEEEPCLSVKKSGLSKKKCKSRKKGFKKPSLLERSVLPQSKYMALLSIPNPKYEEPPLKKRKKKCYIEPCPPRLVQLAVPNKTRVLMNWIYYHDTLPVEMILRFEQILHTDKNLEPREARYYYKILDKQKRKRMLAKRRLRRKQKAEKEKGDKIWLNEQISLTSRAIIDYIKEEPLFALNFKQLMLSDGILEHLNKCDIMRKPSRNTKCYYKKTIVEVSDKLALWMDTLTRFVDVQAVESEQDIARLSISSIGEEEEEEEEGKSIPSSEMEGASGELRLGADQFGEEGVGGEEGGVGGGTSAWANEEAMMADVFNLQEGEGGADLDTFLGDLDEDLLAKLIKILENCSDEFLASLVDTEKMPGVRYIDILTKLKDFQMGLLGEVPKKPFLEEVMIEWAMKNDPDKVDDAMLKKIHDTAALLSDLLGSPRGPPQMGYVGSTDTRPFDDFGEEGDQASGMDRMYDAASRGVTDSQAGPDQFMEGESGAYGPGMYDEEKLIEETQMTDILLGDDAEAQVGAGFIEEIIDKEIGLGGGPEEGYPAPDEFFGEEAPGEKEISVLFEQLEGPGVIKGHKPPVTVEHSPSMVCCLSLKTWAVWLLEITHNAHNWTRWVAGVIKQVREFAATVRGDIKLPDGQPKKLYKEDWRKFTKETEEMIIAWRQYSAHVKELSSNIIDNFHGKKVNCCPKCLQDHLIKNVVMAHETLAALTDAMNCANYWQTCLDQIVEKTTKLTDLDEMKPPSSTSSDASAALAEFEELQNCLCKKLMEQKRREAEDESGESVYEFEEIETGTAVTGGQRRSRSDSQTLKRAKSGSKTGGISKGRVSSKTGVSKKRDSGQKGRSSKTYEPPKDEPPKTDAPKTCHARFQDPKGCHPR